MSTITFDDDGKVSGWKNNDQLNKGMYTAVEGANKLDIGLTKDEVLSLFGSPSSIDRRDQSWWTYEMSHITFDEAGKVSGWRNNDQLNNGLYTPVEGAKKLDIGLTKDEVRDLLGSPSSIDRREQNWWTYWFSYVTFDEAGRVSGWLNNDQLTDYLDK